MAKNNPVTICAIRQIPRSVPKFHHPLIVDGVGKSTKALFAILNKGCLFHNFKSKIHFEYPTVAHQVTKFFASYTN